MWQFHMIILLMLMEGTGLKLLLTYHAMRHISFMDLPEWIVGVFFQLDFGMNQLKNFDAYQKIKVSKLIQLMVLNKENKIINS